MDIAIIGGGWYGCYIAEYIIDNYKDINITLIDKEKDIFQGSSSKNQNRLHLGFHYPRCNLTKNKCSKYFNKFLSKYKELTNNIDKNYYIISKTSKIKYNDYLKQYDDYEIVSNNNFRNIEGDIINTKEMYINFIKTYSYFKNKFNKRINYMFNYNVKTIQNTKEQKVNINDEYIFDKVFNCSYNQIGNKIDDNIIFEKCITLLYKKISNNLSFDCLTIMDGEYSSLFYYDKDLYTLTDVKHTPLIKSNNFKEVYEFNSYNINDIIRKFENNIMIYYPQFKDNFEYIDYYISFKCKNNNIHDSRDINITIDNNIINIWCGKISLIFELDTYIKKIIY